MAPELHNLRLSLGDLVGETYINAVCEARAFLEGGEKEEYLEIAREKIDFFSEAYQEHLDRMLEAIGERVSSGLPSSSDGAGTAAFNKVTNKDSAPLSASGFFRIGEDGRLYLITKSEHYHASLGHDFPGYHLLENARRLGITNTTHNNTRGHITRRLERELIRVANGLPASDEASLERILQSNQPHLLNRVINLETGSLAVEAALKMMLARFYRLEDTFPKPKYSGRVPVFLVLADQEGGKKANYHGTTILTQILRGMWPDLADRLETNQAYVVKQVRLNDFEDFKANLLTSEEGNFKTAGFFHEIILMNYGAIRLDAQYLHAVYDLCHRHDTPIIVDEIQSCIWSPEFFLYREYGLNPDFVSVGKGFPGGQYPASRILTTAEYDNLNQFGALVTNGQEELASLAYLITMAFVESNREYIAALGDHYSEKLKEVVSKFPRLVERVEGYRHLSSIFFYDAETAIAFMKTMNQAGYDVSAQTYKAKCPPAILTKLPIISSYKMVDRFIDQIEEGLRYLN